MKTFLTVSAIALLAAGAAYAEAALPATYIVHKLTSDGVQLRSLEAERGLYEARIEATDGSIIKVGIDPQTAELTDAFSHSRSRPAKEPAPKVNAAEAIQVAAATGYWDVSEVEYERGQWEIKARDDNGDTKRISVDGVTAQVK